MNIKTEISLPIPTGIPNRTRTRWGGSGTGRVRRPRVGVDPILPIRNMILQLCIMFFWTPRSVSAVPASENKTEHSFNAASHLMAELQTNNYSCLSDHTISRADK